MPAEPPVAPETPALSAATTAIQPRADEAQATADAAAATEAESARQRVAKTAGFWNRISPPKEGESPKPKEETKPAEGETKGAKGETEKPKGETKKGKGEKTEAQPPEASEPPAEPEKPKRRKREEPDALQIAEATGKALAREMKTAAPAPAAPARPEPEADLPDEFKRDVAVFEEMARSDPKRYGKIKEDLARYASSENKYIEKWEAEHPGETFDGDAEEHNEFYNRIKPDYDQADFETAKTTLIENRAVERAKKEAREEFQKEYEAREQMREKAAKITPEVDVEMIGLLGEMAKEVDTSGEFKGWPEIEALKQKNKLLYDVLEAVNNRIKPLLTVNKRVFRGIDRFDSTQPAHEYIGKLVEDYEERVQNLPARDRYHDDGRMFATQKEYVKMPPSEQKKHWYIGEEETAAILRGQAKRDTKMLYERELKRLSDYASILGATQKPQPATNGQPPKPDPAPQTRHETVSPSVSGRGTLPGDGQGAPKNSGNGRDRFFDRFLS